MYVSILSWISDTPFKIVSVFLKLCPLEVMPLRSFVSEKMKGSSLGFCLSENVFILWRYSVLRTSVSQSVSSVAQSCPTLCDPMNSSMPGLLVHHQFLEFTQTHVHQVGDAMQPSHPLSSPSPPAPNPSQHQSLFQWVNSSHEVAKVLEFQL